VLHCHSRPMASLIFRSICQARAKAKHKQQGDKEM
jgi:hypothetical protein